MDKNQFIGFVLIGIILIGFFYLTKPTEEQLELQRQQNKAKQEQALLQDSLNRLNAVNQQDSGIVVTDSTVNIDSVLNQQLINKFGQFAAAATGEKSFYNIKNDLVNVEVTGKGGRVYSVNLTNYKTYSKGELILFDGDENEFDFQFFADGKLIRTSDLYFEADTKESVIDASTASKSLRLKAKITNDKYIEYVYTLTPGSYLVDFSVNFVNLDKIIPNNTTTIDLHWNSYLRHLERGEKWEREKTVLYYKIFKSDVEKLNPTKDLVEESIDSKVRWIGYKQQFFASVLIAKTDFEGAKMTAQSLEDKDTLNVKYMTSKISVPFRHSSNVNIPLAFYFGPNKFSILKKAKVGDEKLRLEKMIFLGRNILSFINRKMIIPFFNLLEKYISSFGIIILIMTIVIKLLLFPLTYKSYASGAKMRILKPEIDKATAKFTKQEDAMKKQQVTMNIYKKAGVNPLGGCLPLLLQFPFLVALFRFFPASIELRQQSFLWVNDLSTYDAIVSWNATIPIVNWIFGHHISLFTLLMAIAMIVNTMLSNSNMDDSNPQAKSMKIMMYFMPLLMVVWFNDYSAGLSYYYFISTTIGILQIILIRKFINEEKVLKKMKENMKKNKAPKKNKFLERLEEAQRQQQKQLQNNKKRKK